MSKTRREKQKQRQKLLLEQQPKESKYGISKKEVAVFIVILIPLFAVWITGFIGHVIVDQRLKVHVDYINELNAKGYSLEEIDKWLKDPDDKKVWRKGYDKTFEESR